MGIVSDRNRDRDRSCGNRPIKVLGALDDKEYSFEDDIFGNSNIEGIEV